MHKITLMSGIMIDNDPPQTLYSREVYVENVNRSSPEQTMRSIAKIGDVFQITKTEKDRNGWLGSFVMATEIKSWGIQGFVHMINTHEDSGRAFIRLEWDSIEWVGSAIMIPADDVDTTEDHDTAREEETLPELIEIIGKFETNRIESIRAVAIVEDLHVPEEYEPLLMAELKRFIAGIIGSHDASDIIAIDCAIRKFIFLHKPADFDDIVWLIDAVQQDTSGKLCCTLIALSDFLRHAPPKDSIDAETLIDRLTGICRKFFVDDLFSYSEQRVIAFKSLMSLALLGSPEAKTHIQEARRLGKKSLIRHAQDMLKSLNSRDVGSNDTKEILRAMLEDDR